MQTKNSKTEVLIQQWEKHVQAMQLRCKKGGKDMNDFMNKILKIKTEVRDYLLQKFVDRCLQKHCLAFFQWRQRYRSEFVDKQLIGDCIESRITHLKKSVNQTAPVSHDTMKQGNMSVSLEFDFQIQFKGKNAHKNAWQPYLVNSF